MFNRHLPHCHFIFLICLNTNHRKQLLIIIIIIIAFLHPKLVSALIISSFIIFFFCPVFYWAVKPKAVVLIPFLHKLHRSLRICCNLILIFDISVSHWRNIYKKKKEKTLPVTDMYFRMKRVVMLRERGRKKRKKEKKSHTASLPGGLSAVWWKQQKNSLMLPCWHPGTQRWKTFLSGAKK